MFVLLVTWLVAGQPPASTQTEFTTMASCQVALAQVFYEQKRLADKPANDARLAGGIEIAPGVFRSPSGVIQSLPAVPTVTAFCAKR